MAGANSNIVENILGYLMKAVYTHENGILAQNARNLLRNAGIETVLKNEFASGGVGDLAPGETWPEVCVLDDADYDRAINILKTFTVKADKPDWRCESCNELNGTMFETCWNCQTEPAP